MPRARVASAAIGALAALLLVQFPGAALAVKGETPTLTCTGPCEFCLEMEGPSGRCVKCGLKAHCAVAPTAICTGPCEFCLEMEGPAGRCTKCGLTPGCSDNEFLNAHNAHRDRHCTPKLKWSAQLAAAAQSYANKCKYVHDADRGDVGRESVCVVGHANAHAAKRR